MIRIQYILLLLVSLFFVSVVHASDVSINCNGNSCSNEKLELFGSIKNWYPGMWIKKTFEVKNTDTKDYIQVKLESGGSESDTSSCHLETQMILSISNTTTKAVLWAGSLQDLYTKTNGIYLSSIAPKIAQEYSFIVSFNQESTDTCQNASTTFPLDFYLESLGEISVNNTCDDMQPSSAPQLTSVITDAYGYTLNWKPALSPVSYYSLSYGTSSGNYTSTNPNAGGHGTTSYTLSGLNKNSRYYFVLQAGNGCSLSGYSNEVSMNVPTPTLTENQPTQSTLTDTIVNTNVDVPINSPAISQNIQIPTGSVLGESISQTPQKSENPLKTLLDNKKTFPIVTNRKSQFVVFIFPLICIVFFYVILKNRRNKH